MCPHPLSFSTGKDFSGGVPTAFSTFLEKLMDGLSRREDERVGEEIKEKRRKVGVDG